MEQVPADGNLQRPAVVEEALLNRVGLMSPIKSRG